MEIDNVGGDAVIDAQPMRQVATGDSSTGGYADALTCLHLHRRFDLPQAGIDVDPAALGWPSRGAAAEEGLYCNRQYGDLRGVGLRRARRILLLDLAIVRSFERALTGSLRDAERAEERRDIWQERLMGLDAGVASTVAMISTTGGVPVSSCNAGALGGDHLEPFPLVAFHWRAWALPILEDCVRVAGMSLWLGKYGELVLAGDRLPRFLVFAEALYSRHLDLARLRRDVAATARPKRKCQTGAIQLDLFAGSGSSSGLNLEAVARGWTKR